ncbi:MAG: hypothetical protein SGI88_09895, partial [Candidatus Hydrogenedentes bacterium]|nr:hypothetical protein [Candidatus Hydrogenedentota bacterium]
KNSIRMISPVFNTHRMVSEYADRFYLPCTIRRNTLRDKKRSRSATLAGWKQGVRASWEKVQVLSVESGPTDALPFNSHLPVRADLSLDKLTDSDVSVEVYHGEVDAFGRILDGKMTPMRCVEKLDGNIFRFEGAILCDKTGQQGFTVRAVPSHLDMADKHEMALICWA